MKLYVCYHESAWDDHVNQEVCMITDDEAKAIAWVNKFKPVVDKYGDMDEWRSYAEHTLNKDLWQKDPYSRHGGSVKSVSPKMTQEK